MVGKINLWAQGIVIAVIIGTVLQMIIPENKNKKYIKIVIGIYILFCIINPVVGNSLNLNEYSLEQYMTINQTNRDATVAYDSNVRNAFIQKVRETIKKQLNLKGYDSNNITIETDDNYNVKSIHILNIEEYNNNSQIVNKIEVTIKDKPAKGMPMSEKQEMKQFIKGLFDIEENNIIIE